MGLLRELSIAGAALTVSALVGMPVHTLISNGAEETDVSAEIRKAQIVECFNVNAEGSDWNDDSYMVSMAFTSSSDEEIIVRLDEESGNMLMSQDGGITWEEMNWNTKVENNAGIDTIELKFGEGGQIFLSKDGGITWEESDISINVVSSIEAESIESKE